jgi:hypothetical protein
MISLATGYFRCCRPADRPLKKVARARTVELVQWRSQPGMAGQGDKGAAEQSSRPPQLADSYAAAAEAAAAAAIRLISAHVRVLGEAYVHCGSLPPMPPSAPTRSRMPTPRLGLPPPRAQSVSSRHASTHVGTRHQREAAIHKEMAAAPNALSVTRDVVSVTRQRRVSRSISIVPVYFWGAC